MPIPENVENLRRVSAKSSIYQVVCSWIITGVLKPGEKIVDSELAKRFNVSRTPVREAIQILEGQKLVYVVPGRATVVADIDPADIEKCYRTLAELQGLAAELACGSLTDRELEQLERIHAAFVDACGRNDGTDAITQDNLFHDAIVRGAHNEYVEEFSHTMILHIQTVRRFANLKPAAKDFRFPAWGNPSDHPGPGQRPREGADAEPLALLHGKQPAGCCGYDPWSRRGIRTGCSDKVKMGRESKREDAERIRVLSMFSGRIP